MCECLTLFVYKENRKKSFKMEQVQQLTQNIDMYTGLL
jgi:hypothetical protein